MKIRKQCLVALLLTAVFLLLSASPVLAADIQAAYAKIPDDLLAEFDAIPSNQKIKVIAWIEDDSTSEYEEIVKNIPEPEFVQNNDTNTYSVQSISSNEELSEEERMAQIEQMQNYIMQKRQIAQAVYLEDNTAKANEISSELDDGEIYYISKYSPLIIYNVNKSDAVNIARCDSVLSLSNGNVEGEDCSDVASSTIGANVMENYGYTGQGIKVGMIESGTPMIYDFECFDGVSNRIILKSDATYDSIHATQVAAILIGNADGVVRDCTALYCAATTMIVNLTINVEWMLDNGVNVINFSWGGSRVSEYDGFTKWIEHIVYQHSVHCVAGTGNLGENSVTNIAMAYNVISVGATNDMETSNTNDDTIMEGYFDGEWRQSAYNSSDTIYANKPDLCAPGQDVGIMLNSDLCTSLTGTSFSAPYVTGAVAMLCSYRAFLLDKPELMKSILCSSVSKNAYHKYSTSDSGYVQFGSGILNVSNARLVAQGSYIYGTINSSTMQTFNIGQCSAGTTISVVLCYLRGVGTPSDEHTSAPSASAETLSNLNIYLLPISATSTSQAIANSKSTKNNVEKIVCQIPTTGEYKIIVHRKYDTVNNEVRFAASWQRHSSTIQ